MLGEELVLCGGSRRVLYPQKGGFFFFALLARSARNRQLIGRVEGVESNELYSAGTVLGDVTTWRSV